MGRYLSFSHHLYYQRLNGNYNGSILTGRTPLGQINLKSYHARPHPESPQNIIPAPNRWQADRGDILVQYPGRTNLMGLGGGRGRYAVGA